MLRTYLQPVLWTSRVLKKAIFQVRMSKSAVLETPFFNIPDWKLITREEMSQIRQTLYDFSKPILEMKHSKTPIPYLPAPQRAPECAPVARY